VILETRLFHNSYFRGGLRKAHVYFETERAMAVQGHPRSVTDFGANRKLQWSRVMKFVW